MKKIIKTISPFIFPILFLIFWELIANKIDNQAILPRINEVLDILLNPTDELIGTGSLLTNIGVSMLRGMIAYIIAVIVGIPLGFILGTSKFLNRLLYNFINLFRPIPPLAWSPLVLAWFGVMSIASILDMGPKDSGYSLWNSMRISMIFIIFTASFFVILQNTMQGVKSVNQKYIDSSKVHGASQLQVFTKVLLPGALPSIVTGLRIGLSNAWLALVCAEMLPGSISGIGYLITHSYQLTRIDIVVAGIATIAIVNFIIDAFFRFIEAKFFKWQRLTK